MRAERLALGIAGLALASPATRWVADRLAEQQSLCPLLRLTGVPCPSCGGTRAALNLLAGDPVTALSLNAGATIFIAVVGIALMAGLVHGGSVWPLIGVTAPAERGGSAPV